MGLDWPLIAICEMLVPATDPESARLVIYLLLLAHPHPPASCFAGVMIVVILLLGCFAPPYSAPSLLHSLAERELPWNGNTSQWGLLASHQRQSREQRNSSMWWLFFLPRVAHDYWRLCIDRAKGGLGFAVRGILMTQRLRTVTMPCTFFKEGRRAI